MWSQEQKCALLQLMRCYHDELTADNAMPWYQYSSELYSRGINQEYLAKRDPAETFRFFVLASVFQMGRDVGGIRAFNELSSHCWTDIDFLQRHIQESRTTCSYLQNLDAFYGCDYRKSRSNNCTRYPNFQECVVKQLANSFSSGSATYITQAIISAALDVEEHNNNLNYLYCEAIQLADAKLTAEYLILKLKRYRGIGDKLSHMFCAFMSNPDVERNITVWQNHVDWTYFVAIDTHVKRVLGRLGIVRGSTPSYSDCHSAIRVIASQVDLREIEPQFQSCNPRLVEWMLWMHGQEICAKRHPACNCCCIQNLCPKIGVSHC